MTKVKTNFAALFTIFFIFISYIQKAQTINCYSGSQLQIIECSSLSCIKQSLGLDTVRYCDGQGTSSICQTYRLADTCQNIPNLGYICCCSENMCNSAGKPSIYFGMLLIVVITIALAFGFQRV